MEGHAKKRVERYCDLSNKTTQQFYKVSAPCIDFHHFKDKEMKFVGGVLSNYSKMCTIGAKWKAWYSIVSE